MVSHRKRTRGFEKEGCMSGSGLEIKAAYRVEAEEGKGCTTCGAGCLWTIVGPDEVAESTSWGDRDMAELICEAMNDAYEQGVKSVTKER
jgi:hypothetical protein